VRKGEIAAPARLSLGRFQAGFQRELSVELTRALFGDF